MLITLAKEVDFEDPPKLTINNKDDLENDGNDYLMNIQNYFTKICNAIKEQFQIKSTQHNYFAKKEIEYQNQIQKIQEKTKEKDLQIHNLLKRNNESQIIIDKKLKELKELQKKIHELNRKDKEEGQSISPKRSIFHEIKILSDDDINELDKLQEIGSGGSGKVYKVASKIYYALKEMKIENLNVKNMKCFIKEYEIMNMLNHPNILKSLGIFFGNETEAPKILIEFCPNNLDSAIKNELLTKCQTVINIYQIAEGMKYVHFQKIVHRDLKPSNILIANDGTIKICDFGISKLMTVEEQTTTVTAGTQKYIAPEIIDESSYDEKADVYSFGVLIYFLLNKGDISKIKLSDIMRGKQPEIPDHFTSFAKNLINMCLSFDSCNRPSFDMILDEMEKNEYNLITLSKLEIDDIKNFVKSHKLKIPSY